MSDIKQCFVSRFEDGITVEADFSALEFYVAAVLAEDDILIHELQKGLDPHLENAAVAFNISTDEVTKEQRTHAKQMTFQLLYGASAYAMSKTFELEERFCTNFIDKFYNKYHGIREWHTKMQAQVRMNNGLLKSNTGRLYKFEREETRKGTREYNPRQIKNYPVQGGAWDIVSLTLAALFKPCIRSRDKFLLVNCVHDSFLFDCRQEYLQDLISLIRNTEKSLVNYVEMLYNIKTDLAFKLDIAIGDSWGTVKDYHETEDNTNAK